MLPRMESCSSSRGRADLVTKGFGKFPSKKLPRSFKKEFTGELVNHLQRSPFFFLKNIFCHSRGGGNDKRSRHRKSKSSKLTAISYAAVSLQTPSPPQPRKHLRNLFFHSWKFLPAHPPLQATHHSTPCLPSLK